MEQCGTECLKWPFLPPPAIEGPEGGPVDPVRARRFVRLAEQQVVIERRLEMNPIIVVSRLEGQGMLDPLPCPSLGNRHRGQAISRLVAFVRRHDFSSSRP